MTWTIDLVAAALAVATTLMFATLGAIMMEKVGMLNLGIEGLMLFGAITGFAVATITNNPMLAIMASFVAGIIGGLIYAFLTVSLRANQVVTGLALTFFATGLTNFVGRYYGGQAAPESVRNFFSISVPILKHIPIIGPILFQQDLLVYSAIILAITLNFYFKHTRVGLRARMVGDNPSAADAIGIPVIKYKYIHILIGSGIVALSGAYLSLIYVPSWQENITAGRGWIAIALVVFVSWRPTLVIFGSLFFGILEILGSRLQNTAFSVSRYYMDLLPYIMTIVVLILISYYPNKQKAPSSLGQSYDREAR